MAKITVITPSIRPDGLKAVFETLKKQDFKDVEWLPRLSIPGKKPDLAYQMNQALKEAKGELIVFLQDWIKVKPSALSQMWKFYESNPKTAWTAPVGKVKTKKDFRRSVHSLIDEKVEWDWRPHWKGRDMEYHRWEIDWGAASREVIMKAGLFDEQYDSGFGWENVDLAYRMSKQGVKFACDNSNLAIAFDHDANKKHPFKGKPNADLWARRKKIIDLMYE